MKIEWTPEKKEAVCKKLEEWLIAHHAYSGEMMQQNDDCNIEANNLLSEIVDEIIQLTIDDEEG